MLSIQITPPQDQFCLRNPTQEHQKCFYYLQFRLASNLLNKSSQDVGFAGELIKLCWCQTSLFQDVIQTGQLLSSISVTLGHLVKNLDIVLGILVLGLLLETSGSLGSFSSNFSNARSSSELGDKGIKSLDGTSGGIKSTSNSSVCASLAVEESDEVTLSTSTLVCLWLSGSLREELNGGI
jgi:hypothetical protein